MRPTFLCVSDGQPGYGGQSANIDVTGNNIANVNTERLYKTKSGSTSISIPTADIPRKFTVRAQTVGLGVEVSNISQIRDPFLDARYRAQASETDIRHLSSKVCPTLRYL
jgi:flagellar hook-associated protein 1 FlgK